MHDKHTAKRMQVRYEKAAQEVWDTAAAQLAPESVSAQTEHTGAKEYEKLEASSAENTELDVVGFNLTPSEALAAAEAPQQSAPRQQLDSAEAAGSQAARNTDRVTGSDARGVQDTTVAQNSTSVQLVQLVARVAALIRRHVGVGDRMVSPAEVRSHLRVWK